MNKKEKLALFLGMLSGDGCIPLAHSGEGFRDYAIDFCNTDKEKVILFQRLLFDLFELDSKIYFQQRENRRKIWNSRKYSKKIVEKLVKMGFPEGVKRDKLRILEVIKGGTKKQKMAFIYGVLITDGSINQKRILFHSGSKLFLEDLSDLISEFIGIRKPVREFVQREIYKSYQLCLNKAERDKIISLCPHATMVLG